MNKLKAFLAVSASVTMLSVFGCASVTPYVEPPLPEGGLLPPGGNLTEKLAWLEKGADSRNLYIVEVKADENIAPRTLEYAGATDVGIVLRGIGENRTLRLASHGTMFTVKPNVTLVLDNITLHGHSQNTGPMVEVDGGNFVMRSGTVITGNDNRGNQWGNRNGGGVYVKSGNFRMVGFSIISNNTADNGGGVYVDRGIFEMHCGMINGNIANKKGGGVYNNSYRTERSSDGSRETISNFTMGVMGKDAFTKNNGCAMIAGNTAREEGGGVYFRDGYRFFRHGIVFGYNHNDSTNSNVVKDEGGNVITGKGHAYSRSGPCYGSQYGERVNIPCGNDGGIGETGDAGWGDIKSMAGNINSGSSAPAATEPPAPAPPEPPLAVVAETPPTAAPEPPAANDAALASGGNIDPRLVGGTWYSGKNGCTKWSFGADGKMSLEFQCDAFNNVFTAVNGRIKFLNKIDVCDEDGCENVEMPGRDYSFSDDGKTLILDKENFTRGGPVSCCPH